MLVYFDTYYHPICIHKEDVQRLEQQFEFKQLGEYKEPGTLIYMRYNEVYLVKDDIKQTFEKLKP